MRSLHAFFLRSDTDNSGQISVPEFIDLIGATDSSFVRVLIDLMVFEWADLDADDQLNFDELVLASCVVCTLNINELMHILFQVFDTDRSGQVGHREFAKLARAVADLGAMFPGNYTDFIKRFDKDGSGDVDFDEFLSINEHYPMLFYPVKQLQGTFRDRTLGPARWEQLNPTYVDAHPEHPNFSARLRSMGLHFDE